MALRNLAIGYNDSPNLKYCQDAKPDILAMGAFSHAKLREDLFGGVTKHIMEHMTLPVLMSH